MLESVPGANSGTSSAVPRQLGSPLEWVRTWRAVILRAAGLLGASVIAREFTTPVD